MAPLTRAQMKQLAEDALRAVQEWLTAIPREILKKLSPDSLFYVMRPNPLWPLRRFTIGKLGQTNKANLEILNERRRNIISRFETLVGGTLNQVRQDRWEKAEQYTKRRLRTLALVPVRTGKPPFRSFFVHVPCMETPL